MAQLLCVEEDVSLALLARASLAKLGHRLDIAATGEKGQDRLAAEQYDLVILGHTAPRKDGLTILRNMQALPSAPPIVMVCGTKALDVAVDALRLGAADYVVKDEHGAFFDLLPSVIQEVLCREHLLRARKDTENLNRIAEMVFQNVAEGILITDPDTRIIAINPAFSSITGYTTEEIIGNTPSILSSGRHDKAFYRRMWEAIELTGQWQVRFGTSGKIRMSIPNG
ncbi:putative diguanylate cyclase/phosphodiesterase (GGDEF & EAL domains) with PAS/PAC sensor(S) and response regulator [Methylocaldum marinum]|uniref:Putative diguanylate cyclase/phosphodiesterase (GGDEF & EAL domains) with PAS/PAC sensor(S) and response regulator n=1 Tax=Methylocaldum marinum TaxID=1432792 RepID=A0A286P373_9GAMM|nr:response regulator [Methylocaldum marinum]BBA32095.1 putative diguanylate cyclase/phosphodiesterase (GGDEF & EAL domains) with PAS/PAC sensor(S) and response regulator [Methylocaldum marinum]